MKSKVFNPVWLIPLLIIAAAFFTVFDVDQSEKAIILQLGEPVGKPLEPGFHLKVPLIQKATIVDKRLQHLSLRPLEMLTADKQTVIVQTFTEWEIADPLRFYVSVGNKDGAIEKLSEAVLSEVQNEVGRCALTDIISAARTEHMASVVTRVKKTAKSYGISVLDIRIERIQLPEVNQEAVFAGMRSERERQTQKILAEGRKEALEIQGEAEKNRTATLAEAHRQALEIKGLAEAETAEILADAFNRDIDFFTFVRTLELYRNSIDERTTLFLSHDDELLQLMNRK